MTQLLFSDTADQSFSELVDGKRMTFRFRYNTTSAAWSMDISVDGTEKMLGRRLVYGLNPFYHEFFKGALICDGAQPTRQSLPDQSCQVYVVSEKELDAELAA